MLLDVRICASPPFYFDCQMEYQELPDYFAFYEMPFSLSVDAAALRRAYLEKSRQFHPDFHTRASAEDQARMLEFSSYNNEAYNTLSDPDLRLRYVLNIKGLLAEEGKEEKLSQDFLMEMMEVNEQIMELEFDPSKEQYEKALHLADALEEAITAPVRKILATWTEDDGDGPLLAARDYFLKKRYLLRVKENLSKFAAAF